MNIQEAARLMEQGKLLRRKSWTDPTRHAHFEFNGIWMTEGWPRHLGGTSGSLGQQAKFAFDLHDLTADDWEEILPPTFVRKDDDKKEPILNLEGVEVVG